MTASPVTNWTDTDLCRIALKYHTDKCHTDDNKFSHNYTPYYNRLLSDHRQSVRKVLEIGLGWAGLMHGEYPFAGSLLMWRDYFPNAQIFGLDIRPDCLRNEDRICSHICDQGDEASLRRAAYWAGGSNIDLIIDDGSHIPAHQILTAKIFMPLLMSNGLYVIEDVHTPELVEVCTGLLDLGFSHELIEVDNPSLPDDRLILIRIRK